MNLENKNLNRGLTTGPHPSVGGSPAQLPCFAHAGAMADLGLAAALRERAQSGPAAATARRSRRRNAFPASATWGSSGERAGEHK